jgi:predicted metal-dependent phosphoesterase TrpH
VDEFKVLKGDFHIHTLFSDGLVMPKDRITEAVDNGLDVIAITDHIEYRPYLGGNSASSIKLLDRNDDHNLSYDIAKPEADKQNLILVRGTEITKSVFPPGHFNALFIEDANAIAAVVDDWRKMLAVATDQGGFVQWNHPGWVANAGLKAGEAMYFPQEHEEAVKKGHLHGVEIFNGTS